MAGGETMIMESYRTAPTEASSLYEIATAYAWNVRVVEDRFLQAAWLNPRRMHDVALETGLTAESFAIPEHQFMFAYLGMAVEAGVLELKSVNDCAAQARKLCLVIEPNRWLDEILRARADCDGNLADELEELARTIVAFGARREVARAKLAEVRDLLQNDPTDVDDLSRSPRPKAAVVPSRIRQRKGRRHAITV